MAFDPFMQTNLMSEKAQGANVGDIRDGYRWSGANWEKEAGGGGSSYGGGGNWESTVQRAIELQKQAVQPAVTALQAEKDPLKARYANLIAQIKGNQVQAEQKQTLATSNEMGKRGILPSSGLAQQEMVNAVNPITQQYTGLLSNAQTEQESNLRGIDTAIAQLLAGAAQGGITTGAGIYQNEAQRALQQQQLAQQQQQQAIENALAQKQYEEVTKPMAQYELGKPYYKPDEPVDNSWYKNLLNLLGGENVISEPKPTTKPQSSSYNPQSRSYTSSYA